MRITRVQLENIKSYRRVSVPLGAGTIAIRGQNGAGKSTLVEAIGFALFDALNYDQAQFVREGERSGTVTVTFVSALDDREYQAVRRCGSAAAWYIYDPDLAGRVVEQRADVIDFLRRHLRIESELALKDLFNDALGVPQGTFTADFLLTPSNRKKKFDGLLQVEDYRRAAEKLAETRSYLQDERRAVEQRINDLERETQQLDGWRAERERLHAAEQQLIADLSALGEQIDRVAARHQTLQQQQAEVTQRANAAQIAEQAHANAASRQRDALQWLEEARAAVRICAENQADFTEHNTAQSSQRSAHERARQRDTLTSQRSVTAQQIEGVRRDHHHTQVSLDAARAAEQRIVALVGPVQRQAELERQRDQVRHDAQTLAATLQRLAQEQQEATRLDAEIDKAERAIAEIDTLRPVADLREERLLRVTRLQSIRATRTEKEKRRSALAKEYATATTRRDNLLATQSKQQENVRKLLASQAEAEAAPALEVQYAEALRVVQDGEAEQKHHRRSREQSSAGQCPFLREPCLNIANRGENNFGTYFDTLIAQAEQRLIPARARAQQLLSTLEHARTVRHYYEQLPQFQENLHQLTEQLAEAEAQVVALRDEEHELTTWLDASPGEPELAEAQGLLAQSENADKRLRALEPVQTGLARDYERHARLTETLATLATQRDALAQAPQHLTAVEQELAALGDPRSDSAANERTARERPQLEQVLAAHAATLTRLQQDLAAHDAALQPFATLDAELQTLHAAIERTQPGHARYLQHQQTAEQLAAREASAAQAEQAAGAALHEHETALASLARAQAAFSLDELTRTAQQVRDLGAERGRATEELRHTKHTSVLLAAEITRVEALLDDLRTAQEERDALKRTEEMLQQFRETIKEAGPNIMKAVLRQISVEANRIFGEIMGDRAAQLSWESDYEVVLRRDGKERSFAQLSGGEQMSAALAVRLALLRSLTRLDIAFFDEPTQNMDGERRGNLAEQIRRVRGFEQLLVISHDDTFEQGLDSVIHLEKRNGETRLIEEDALVSI